MKEYNSKNITIIQTKKSQQDQAMSNTFSINNLLWGRQTIHFIQDYPFPIERVFQFFAKHENMGKFYPGAFKRVVDSLDPRNINGIGSVRRITTIPFIFEETITRFEEPYLIEYKITSSSPLKNHIGTMKFATTDLSSCRLDYTISFDPLVPLTGFLLKNTLQKAVGNGIREVINILRENPEL